MPDRQEEQGLQTTYLIDRRLGRRLDILIRGARLTQKQLAESSGVDKTTISKVVKGHRRLTREQADAIAAVLSVKSSYLLPEETTLRAEAEIPFTPRDGSYQIVDPQIVESEAVLREGLEQGPLRLVELGLETFLTLHSTDISPREKRILEEAKRRLIDRFKQEELHPSPPGSWTYRLWFDIAHALRSELPLTEATQSKLQKR